MRKSFYTKLNGAETVIEFTLAVEQEDGEYTFDLEKITSVFDEGASEEVNYDQEEVAELIYEWLDENNTKLINEVENSEY